MASVCHEPQQECRCCSLWLRRVWKKCQAKSTVADSVFSRAVSVFVCRLMTAVLEFWSPHTRNSLAESSKVHFQELELTACNGNFPLGFCESLQHNPWWPGPACDLWCFSQYCQSGAARGRWEGADAVGAQEGVHPCFSSAPPTHCCWLPSM